MFFKEIRLAGFEHFPQDFSLKFNEPGEILEWQDARKYRFLKIALGILFGLTEDELTELQVSKEKARVVTGYVTIVLNGKIFSIERDFITNIVGCLLEDADDVRPVFQGKDHPFLQRGRPFLDLIQPIFGISDKYLLRDLCLSWDTGQKSSADLFKYLGLLLTGQLIQKNINSLLSQTREIITIANRLSDEDSKNITGIIHLNRESIKKSELLEAKRLEIKENLSALYEGRTRLLEYKQHWDEYVSKNQMKNHFTEKIIQYQAEIEISIQKSKSWRLISPYAFFFLVTIFFYKTPALVAGSFFISTVIALILYHLQRRRANHMIQSYQDKLSSLEMDIRLSKESLQNRMQNFSGNFKPDDLLQHLDNIIERHNDFIQSIILSRQDLISTVGNEEFNRPAVIPSIPGN